MSGRGFAAYDDESLPGGERVVIAVGVDLVEISRIEAVLKRHGDRFLRRVYTDGELSYANERPSALAARWAAKEATAKALGTGIGPVSFREIEVVCDAMGKPGLYLHGSAARLAAHLHLEHFALSLSHAADFALAFVVAQKSGGTD
ncbi:MAG: holo-ACP synthase [Anaerolineales bacterium]|nr:MAG: holo-ACP synthase [Anaerolineales bacterium]